MLPPFIIEQIRQREERERLRQENNSRPRAHLPVEQRPRRAPEATDDDDADRGVVIVDLMG
jgi:hypothetical protein